MARRSRIGGLAVMAAWLCGGNPADGAGAGDEALPFLRTRVRTCVAFKDGTVFIVREGTAKVGKDGTVVTAPITDAAFGTVGASCSTAGVRVKMVTATAPPGAGNGRRSFEEAVGAAFGRPVEVRRRGSEAAIGGTFLGLRPASGVGPAIGIDGLPPAGEDPVLVVKEESGVVSLVSLSSVESWRFQDGEAIQRDPDRTGQRLRIRLEGAREGQEVTISLTHLWRGVRWIPTYLAEREADGKARVSLRAEVVNELLDLEGSELFLVVGVPNFAFLDSPSPMAAQKSIEQVSAALSTAEPARYASLAHSRYANLNTSNAFQLPTEPLEARPPAEGAGASTTALPDIASAEAGSLHLFQAKDVLLRRGERAILSLSEMELPCRDLVEWDIGDACVETAGRTVGPEDRARNPLRLSWALTAGETPLTTGPVLVMKGEVALSQDRIYYTPRGATGKVGVGAATGFQGAASETVVSRREGEREENTTETHHEGRTFWLKRMVRWVDETRRLTIRVRNGSAFEADVVLRRTVVGSPSSQKGIDVQALGGAADPLEQPHRVAWRLKLAPGESKEAEVEYVRRIYTSR